MGNIGISAKAVARLREQVVNSCLEAGIGFRMDVSTDESGEASFSIKVDRQHQEDKVIELNGVRVFLDPDSAAQISDFQLDYKDGADGGFYLKEMQEAKNG